MSGIASGSIEAAVAGSLLEAELNFRRLEAALSVMSDAYTDLKRKQTVRLAARRRIVAWARRSNRTPAARRLRRMVRERQNSVEREVQAMDAKLVTNWVRRRDLQQEIEERQAELKAITQLV